MSCCVALHCPALRCASLRCAALRCAGVAGIMGNKGGCVTALQLDHTTLCFVGSHCAAHQDKTFARNENVREIIKRAKVGARKER